MNLFFDLDKEFLVSKPGASSKLTRADTKQGDVRSITVTFVRGAVVVIPTGNITEMVFVAKRSAGLTAVALLLTNAWTFNATLQRWEGVITQDHARLIDILTNTSTTSLLAEFTFTTSAIGPISSQIFTMSLENDLWKGTEGTPLSLATPLEWLASQLAPIDLSNAPEDEAIYWTGTHSPAIPAMRGIGKNLGRPYFNVAAGANQAAVTWAVDADGLGHPGWLIDSSTDGGATFFNWYSLENVMRPDLVQVWIPVGSATGSPVVNRQGTFANHTYQLARVLLYNRLYTFQSFYDCPAIWEGITSGLVYDDNPISGSPRWRINRLTGEDDERHMDLVDLDNVGV